MNRATRAFFSPVVGAIIALALIWGFGSDVPFWKCALMVVVGAAVAFGLNLAWESNPWNDEFPSGRTRLSAP
ncbi:MULTISPECIES: DUF4175 domain-containing protein [unclassified Rhodococcus (in: high G+C Gram-positive bacteria)]|uniref:DUF4175 domain-containing protein n=1 Tax=unclassified Rhodococcus (in: high G+C Gram-positive bacteria) TaxID=192944 RepID=UPI0011ED3BE8|nr:MULTISPECIES: DUF4175 domain-containing protein [unclassified Rhodococcus (in: high G+C Gram-positive bacteria)]KAA0923822.1 DUF4175 domain-containing protein [Rhodococcus sp. ANT_H53B]MDI9926899.1 hypothetical protein [Rhodococcus sp. IEGM 1341]